MKRTLQAIATSLIILVVAIGICLMPIFWPMTIESGHYLLFVLLVALWGVIYLIWKWWQSRLAQQRMRQIFDLVRQEIIAGTHAGHYGVLGHINTDDFAVWARVSLPVAAQFLNKQAQQFSAKKFSSQENDWGTFDFSGFRQIK